MSGTKRRAEVPRAAQSAGATVMKARDPQLTKAQAIALRRCVADGSAPASTTHPSFKVLKRLGLVERQPGMFAVVGRMTIIDTGKWIPTAAGRRATNEAPKQEPSEKQLSLAREKRHVLEAVESGSCFVAMSHSLMDLGDAGLLVLDHKGPSMPACPWLLTDAGRAALRQLREAGDAPQA